MTYTAVKVEFLDAHPDMAWIWKAMECKEDILSQDFDNLGHSDVNILNELIESINHADIRNENISILPLLAIRRDLSSIAFKHAYVDYLYRPRSEKQSLHDHEYMVPVLLLLVCSVILGFAHNVVFSLTLLCASLSIWVYCKLTFGKSRYPYLAEERCRLNDTDAVLQCYADCLVVRVDKNIVTIPIKDISYEDKRIEYSFVSNNNTIRLAKTPTAILIYEYIVLKCSGSIPGVITDMPLADEEEFEDFNI